MRFAKAIVYLVVSQFCVVCRVLFIPHDCFISGSSESFWPMQEFRRPLISGLKFRAFFGSFARVSIVALSPIFPNDSLPQHIHCTLSRAPLLHAFYSMELLVAALRFVVDSHFGCRMVIFKLASVDSRLDFSCFCFLSALAADLIKWTESVVGWRRMCRQTLLTFI